MLDRIVYNGIIEAILLRNPDLAEARTREHIRNVRADLAEAVTNGGTLETGRWPPRAASKAN